MSKIGLLERLKKGNVIIGDGGFLFALEKMGYVQAGRWTPEAVIENPDAVKRLHHQFIRAGSDICQTFTFFSNKMKHGGGATVQEINDAGCLLAKEAAGNTCLVGGTISGSVNFNKLSPNENLIAEFKSQCDTFLKHGIDFIIIELIEFIEEMEIAIAVCKETLLPVVACMSIGPDGDIGGVSTGECAVRMAKAGADVVGTNCRFGPVKSLQAITLMKSALKKANLDIPLIAQPMAYNTPDVGPLGLSAQPEYPFALEPRLLTRFEVERWTREAYSLGVRYIGGCCGFEPYHIRAIAEELATERGFVPEPTQKHGAYSKSLGRSRKSKPWLLERSEKSYWEFLIPATGRPKCPAFTDPDPRSWELLRKYNPKPSDIKKSTQEKAPEPKPDTHATSAAGDKLAAADKQVAVEKPQKDAMNDVKAVPQNDNKDNTTDPEPDPEPEAPPKTCCF